jgi:hypothetical protein
LKSGVAKKIFAGALVKTYFYHFARTVHISNGHIAQPVIGIHTIATAGAASAITLTSAWFAATGGTATGTTHRMNLGFCMLFSLLRAFCGIARAAGRIKAKLRKDFSVSGI